MDDNGWNWDKRKLRYRHKAMECLWVDEIGRFIVVSYYQDGRIAIMVTMTGG